jgi:prevent-host-death family protein
MKTIAASKFKAQCLRIMDEVNSTREPVTITKRRRAMAKLVPADGKPKDIFGCIKAGIEIVGDIMAPLDTIW